MSTTPRTDALCKISRAGFAFEEGTRELETELTTANARVEKLEETLREMSKQKTLTEIQGDSDLEGGDFEYAYDHLVKMAREALKP
jgi:hypothetical protein